jgi:hypothetical protein
MRRHEHEVAVFMRGFVRADGPKPRPWVEAVYRLTPRRCDKAERRRREIIDDLPAGEQRLVCAAGRLIWRAAVTARLHHPPRSKEVAGAVLEEMRDMFGDPHPRQKSARALVVRFAGPLSLRQMQNLAKANPCRT